MTNGHKPMEKFKDCTVTGIDGLSVTFTNTSDLTLTAVFTDQSYVDYFVVGAKGSVTFKFPGGSDPDSMESPE